LHEILLHESQVRVSTQDWLLDDFYCCDEPVLKCFTVSLPSSANSFPHSEGLPIPMTAAAPLLLLALASELKKRGITGFLFS
jgi:hypothetical protein